MGRSMAALIAEFGARNNVPVSGTIGGTNTTTNQLAGLLRELVEELPSEARLTVGIKSVNFNAIASESQGTLVSIVGDGGFDHIINETVWDRTNMLPLWGPASAEEWEQLKSLDIGGPQYTYRIMANEFLLYPTPAAPLPTLSFEYASTWLFTDNTGVPKEFLSDGADLCLLPDDLLLAGLKWKWKLQKGLPYGEAEKAYYNRLNNYLATDGTKRRVKVDCATPTAEPMIVVPPGNWLQ